MSHKIVFSMNERDNKKPKKPTLNIKFAKIFSPLFMCVQQN